MLPCFSAPSVVHCFVVVVVVPVDKDGGVWLFLLLLVSVNNVFQTCKRRIKLLLTYSIFSSHGRHLRAFSLFLLVSLC